MATARIIANRLLEADEDFDPAAEIIRYTAAYPGYTIETEGHHWNVYKTVSGRPAFIGEITYDDMADMPKETMTPGMIDYWNTHHWYASAGWRDGEQQMCASFDEAVKWIIAVNTVKTAPVRESVDDEDVAGTINRHADAINQPVELRLFSETGRPFRAVLHWDQTSGGTSYDERGRIVPEKPQPIVEFYDLTRADDPRYPTFKDKGQFVSRYYAATLMERPHGGLDLHGGVQEWQINSGWMGQVRDWIKDECETKRSYRLSDDTFNNISFGKHYESLDPDDPELYAHPEKFTAQPSYEKLESTLRIMLRPYYDEIHISRRPAHLARFFSRVKDYWTWTIHCKRHSSLQLPKAMPLAHPDAERLRLLPERVDWRKQVKNWFWQWAKDNGLGFYKFNFYGRLRKDPTFQFDTDAGFVPKVKESEDDADPELMLRDLVQRTDWEKELEQALWEFHPYGVGYTVVGAPKSAFVIANTYFPPEQHNFAVRLKVFVLDWLTRRRVLPAIKSVKLYTFKHAGASEAERRHMENYPQWTVGVSVNVDWPPPSPDITVLP